MSECEIYYTSVTAMPPKYIFPHIAENNVLTTVNKENIIFVIALITLATMNTR